MSTGTDIVDAKAHEAAKTQEERAEDIAYTFNHALSCGLTDIFVQPFASAWIDTRIQEDKIPKWLRWIQNIFEKHDHGDHGHGHDHHHGHHHDHNHKPSLWENTKHWTTGEILGDAGAVPLTIMVQRMFPGFMQGIRNIIEPVAGGLFHNGAKRDARHWARQHGLSPDSPEAKQKEHALYEHELSHLPQAVVWNAFSVPINLGSQYLMAPTCNKPRIFNLVVGKTFGSLVSNTALIGGRAMAPEAFNEWDRFNSKHVIRPVTRTVGGIFGVDRDTVDRVAKKEDELRGDDWRTRVAQEPATEPEPGRHS